MKKEVVTQTILPKIADNSHLIVPIATMCILAVMVIPLPPMLLDFLVTLDITLSVVILLGSMYIDQPVSFSVFPSLL